MTIYAYAGKNGAGKTSQVVEFVIIPALRKGRVVYHNLDLNEPAIWELVGDVDKRGKLIGFSRDCSAAELVKNCPSGCVVVIDEAWRYWRAGIASSKVLDAEFQFFAMHRHSLDDVGREMDIVIIAQDLGTGCASFIRELVQITYHANKLTHVGSKNRYRVDVYNGCVKGDAPPKSKLVRSMVLKRNPAIFNCYKSHTLSTGIVEGGQDIADERGTIWRGWRVKSLIAAVAVAPLFVWLLVHSVGRLVGGAPRPGSEHSERTAAAPLRAPPGGSPVQVGGGASAAPAIADSASWRLSGRVRTRDEDYYLVEGEKGARKVALQDCHPDAAANTVCMVDGQRVTEWTGPQPGPVQRFMAEAVKVPHSS